jgi:sirohydrochlorin cobaltochelatase
LIFCYLSEKIEIVAAIMVGTRKRQVIVLAMHGVPPRDFPRQELREYFELSFKAEYSPFSLSESEMGRLAELERKMRLWPRNEKNDPFYFGSLRISQALASCAGCEVILGFNEFCAPSLEEALEEACRRKPEIVLVLTPMLTPGGEHAAREIPEAIEKAKANHPGIKIIYAWPFEPEEIACFLLAKAKRKLSEPESGGLERER